MSDDGNYDDGDYDFDGGEDYNDDGMIEEEESKQDGRVCKQNQLILSFINFAMMLNDRICLFISIMNEMKVLKLIFLWLEFG